MHLATPLATVLLGGLCLTLPDASGTSARRSGPAEPLTAAPLVAPVCDAGGPYVGECVNGVATVQLDGSASYDPAGRPLDFLWQVECMNAVLVNKNSPTPTLMFDLDGLCTAKCGRVDLFVRNTLGEFTRCSTQVTFED